MASKNIRRTKGKSMTLRNIPQDVYNLIIDRQAAAKKEIGQISMESIVYRMLRELNDKENTKTQ